MSGEGAIVSARALLAKLEGADRDELQDAMARRDISAVRVIVERHRDRAVLTGQRRPEPAAPVMRPRGWTGPSRSSRKTNEPDGAA